MLRLSPTSFGVLLSCLAFAAAPAAALAEKIKLPKPVPVSQKRVDKSKVVGQIVAYDDEGFDLRVKGGEVETVPWRELDAKGVYVIRKSLLNPKDSLGLVELGKALLETKGGEEFAEKAFAAAVKLDPKLKEAVADLRKGNAGGGGAAVRGPKDKAGGKDGELVRDADAPADMAGAENKPAAGPEQVGRIQEEFWRPQTEEQQAESVKTLKAFAEKTQKAMGKELRLNETTYFLFYSELSKQEAKNWSGVLDRMYVKLAEMFAVEKGVNILRGKALVFVFQQKDDYVKFQKLMHDTDAGGSDGMCHTFGDGFVHIAFYRQPNEVEFAHVLVHESVHAFIHRYKSPADIPVWANEGLAEWIASQLVPRAGGPKQVHTYAKLFMQRAGGTGKILEAPNLQDWQYLVAEMLTTYMIERNRKGYVAFVKAMKDGTDWKEALASHYKTTPEKLVHDFARAIGVNAAH